MMAYRYLEIGAALDFIDVATECSPNYADAWFLKAQIFKERKDPRLEEVLGKALSIDAQLHPQAWIDLAQARWEVGRYESGQETLEHIEDLGLEFNTEGQARLNWVRKGIEYSLDVMSRQHEFDQAVPVSGELNSTDEEYYGAVDLSGSRIIFTRSSHSGFDNSIQVGAEGGEDLFQSYLNENGDWSPPVPLQGINTKMNEGAPSLSGNGQVMVFVACQTLRDDYGIRRGKGSCDLFESTYDETTRTWTIGQNMGAPNTTGWESQPTLSADGNTLIFAKSSAGQREPSNLVVCTRLSTGGWSKPKPLPGLVNTPYTEESPFLHPDGKTLYFSSDGHPGLGGLDVFASRLQKDGTWGEPENLGPGINSFGKDNSLIVMPRGGIAMFATSREDNQLDFWQSTLPVHARPIEVAALRGKVVHAETAEPIDAHVTLIDLETGQVIGQMKSSQGSGFVMPLPNQGNYSLEASAPGFLFGMTMYKQKEDVMRDPFVTIALEPISTGKSFVLDAILFDLGVSTLSSSYQAGCERLAQWMIQNENVRIMVVGHTDNVGDASSNQTLSRDRASAVADFLVSRGVPSSRIQWGGRGEEDPIADNSTEEGRSQNRRVEVTILD